MSRRFRFGFLQAVLTAGLAVSGPALGGGFSIYEAGARATAMGGAFVAQADDPSAMFYNPAGIALDGRRGGMLGGTLIFFSSELSTGFAPYPGEGYQANQKDQIFTPVDFYLTLPLKSFSDHPLLKELNVAIGAWTPFGLSTSWENPDSFRGRFLNQRVDLKHYALGFQLSAKMTDWLAVGAGPEVRFSDVKLQRNVPIYNPFTGRPVDAAHADIVNDGLTTTVTWGVGVMVTPMKGLRVGASYHGRTTANFDGTARFYPLPTGSPQLDAAFAGVLPVNQDVPVTTAVQFPGVFIFGVSYDVTDKLTVEADGNYWGWSTFDKTVLSFGTVDGKTPPTSTLEHNWVNTWTARVGARYAATPSIDVMAGGYYDQTPQPDEDVSPLLPDANRTGISFGAGFKIGEIGVVEASNLLLFFHERTTTTNKDNFNATYKTFADLFVINFRTTF